MRSIVTGCLTIKNEIAGDFSLGESPIDLTASQAGYQILLLINQFRLFVAEVDGLAEAVAVSASFPIEGRDDGVFAKLGVPVSLRAGTG